MALKELVETMAKSLVDRPDEVVVSERAHEPVCQLELRVGEPTRNVDRFHQMGRQSPQALDVGLAERLASARAIEVKLAEDSGSGAEIAALAAHGRALAEVSGLARSR